MLRTDFQEGSSVALIEEEAHRIGAAELKVVLGSKIVPELLQLNGSIAVPVGPEGGDHFAKGNDLGSRREGGIGEIGEEISYDFSENDGIWEPVDHELA